jgi:predicted HTH transcriptional regulator
MDIEELKRHLSAGKIEAHLRGVDFKRSWQQAHGKDISAIANDESTTNGWIVVGVDDNGIVAGHDVDWLKKTEHIVSSHIRQYLEPSWAVKSIVGEQIGAGQCLFIEITNPQDVVKWNGKAFHLTGTTSTEMKEHEVLALSLRLPGADFSKAKYSGGYDASLITAFAQKVIASTDDFQIDVNAMSPNEIMRKLNVFETNTGGILFGDFPYRIVHFDENGDILDQRNHKGLYNILSDAFIDDLQSRARKKGTSVHEGTISAQEEMPYPVKALREILANAVAHALYQKNNGDIVVEIRQSRITVRNNCTKEAKAFLEKWFSRINKSTNKHLMNTLRVPKITDEQGTGKIRIFRLMLEAGKREPIASFEDLGDYGRWSITLYNEEGNTVVKNISQEIRNYFPDVDQWRMATALLLWRDYDWSKIESFLDDDYKYIAQEVLKNSHSPVWRYDNSLYTKRWAEIRLTGKVTKEFSEGEKQVWYKLLNRYSFESSGHDGHITSEKARDIIGLSNSGSEMTQLARLFSEWRNRALMEMIKKGHWKFTSRYSPDKT